MNWQTFLNDLRPEILFRLALALAAGFLIGRERESHGRAAGLRTTLLVCLSSCVAMIVSDSFYMESFRMRGSSTGWHPDPARLAAGILAGMGFLGAGVIVHERTNVVHGVTTAATLWFAAIIGLTAGAGALALGAASTALALLILAWIPRFESRMDNDWYSDLRIRSGPETVSTDDITAILGKLGMKIKGVEWKEDIGGSERTLLFHVKYKKGVRLTLPALAIGALKELPGVKEIHWLG